MEIIALVVSSLMFAIMFVILIAYNYKQLIIDGANRNNVKSTLIASFFLGVIVANAIITIINMVVLR